MFLEASSMHLGTHLLALEAVLLLGIPALHPWVVIPEDLLELEELCI
jgi:hypothetical protein